MTRLPKKYFKSITDYVRAYYTAYGAKRAQKLYDAVKTVTKDFTRTDPVYVRIGEDGEPEIHYTMTQADGTSYFARMDLGNATLCVHNFSVVTRLDQCFEGCKCNRVSIDHLNGTTTMLYRLFASAGVKNVALFDLANVTSLYATFNNNWLLSEIPAFDFSKVTDFANAFDNLWGCKTFKGYGMTHSFSLKNTNLTHDAILEVFSNLGTVSKDDNITLTLGSEKLALMSDEEKLIATEKGWYLA